MNKEELLSRISHKKLTLEDLTITIQWMPNSTSFEEYSEKNNIGTSVGNGVWSWCSIIVTGTYIGMKHEVNYSDCSFLNKEEVMQSQLYDHACSQIITEIQHKAEITLKALILNSNINEYTD